MILGGIAIGPMLFGGFFQDAIQVHESRDVLAELGSSYHGAFNFVLHGFKTPALYLALAGVAAAWYIYMVNPAVADTIASRFGWLRRLLENKYGFDDFNERVFAGGSRQVADKLWSVGDVKLIDGLLVNGTANGIGVLSLIIRTLQSGYLFHYAFSMIIGLLALLTIFIIST